MHRKLSDGMRNERHSIPRDLALVSADVIRLGDARGVSYRRNLRVDEVAGNDIRRLKTRYLLPYDAMIVCTVLPSTLLNQASA